LLQIRDRRIAKEQVESTVRKPDRTVPGRAGRVVAEKVFNKRLLRVIYESNEEIVVVTAYSTEKTRYLRGYSWSK